MVTYLEQGHLVFVSKQLEPWDRFSEADDVADGGRDALGELLPVLQAVLYLGHRVEGTRLKQ